VTDQGKRYQRIRAVLCADCPIRPTCPQFPEQMDACADALLVMNEDVEEYPGTLSQFLAECDEED
jgi:hypothetical protein